MVQLAVLSPSSGLRSLHALDLELAAPGALPLAPRLWRLPRDLDTPPPSVAALLQPLNDSGAAICAAAERALLAALDGSCRTPIAALAEPSNGDMRFRAAIVRSDGSELLSTERTGPVANAAPMGRDAADELRGRAGPGFFR